MSQYDFIKDIARYGLSNDQTRLIEALHALIDYSQQINKVKFALQLQSIIKDTQRRNDTSRIVNSTINNEELEGLILDCVDSDFRLNDLICTESVKSQLEYFIKEHQSEQKFKELGIPLSNRVLFYGPSGCGKTLSATVLAGELNRPLTIVNLGTIVSSKLGETSKNLTTVFKNVSYNKGIIFLDEFDSIGKIRDYDQDHGEMKRVVNTLLQLFDFYTKNCIVIAATNQKQMIDSALLRRFDVTIKLDYPETEQVESLVNSILNSSGFAFDDKNIAAKTIEMCKGISYYTIKQSLLNAIKRTIIDNDSNKNVVCASIWNNIVTETLYNTNNG